MSEETLFFQRRTPSAKAPTRATTGSAGFDLRAPGNETVLPETWKLIPLGLSFEFPSETYGRIASRSSLAACHGVFTIGGVIDADYRGAVGVSMLNFSNQPFEIKENDKIAQLIIERCAYPRLAEAQVGELTDTKRGSGGFGSSGQL